MKELADHKKTVIKAAVFDFDGTISTMRCGWEEVMEPLMLGCISGGRPVSDDLVQEVRDYIDRSTGIQTILQMKWLAERTVKENSDAPSDPWYYKKLYNDRLMEKISSRISDAENGNASDYLICGSREFLARLRDTGCTLFAASGTDNADVRHEAGVLGVAGYFSRIEGAKPMSESCSKEATLIELIGESGYRPENILVVGDGPVEIKLGREFGTLTLGIASDEKRRRGFNARKEDRLTSAGAHAIVDCFEDADGIFEWMNS